MSLDFQVVRALMMPRATTILGSGLITVGLRSCQLQSQKPKPYYFLVVQPIGFVSMENLKMEVKREC